MTTDSPRVMVCQSDFLSRAGIARGEAALQTRMGSPMKMISTRSSLIAAATAALFAATALTGASAAQAADSSAIAASALAGTWTGSAEGFSGTKRVVGEVKIVFSKVTGRTATAKKYWRQAGATTWMPGQPVLVIVHEDHMITALDRDGGLFAGELEDDTHMHGDLVEIGKPNKFMYFDLTKSS